MGLKSLFVDLLILWGKSSRQTDQNVLRGRAFSFRGGNWRIIYRIPVKEVAGSWGRLRWPWMPVWPRQSVRAGRVFSPPHSLLDRWGNGGLDNLLKAPSLLNGKTRVITEFCFTCLQTCPMDCHVSRACCWLSPLGKGGWTSPSFRLSEFLPSTRSHSWLSLLW